jgi:anti-sigma regulatory factor (Ser/Thr protein kinase)
MTTSCDLRAPARIRRAVRELREPRLPLGDAVLVASELAANAVRHSGAQNGSLTTCIQREPDRIRISVLDPGLSGRTAGVPESDGEFGGWGLKIVERLALRWGTRRRTDGYAVWAELPLAKRDPTRS